MTKQDFIKISPSHRVCGWGREQDNPDANHSNHSTLSTNQCVSVGTAYIIPKQHKFSAQSGFQQTGVANGDQSPKMAMPV